MACQLYGAKPVSEPMLGLLLNGPMRIDLSEIWIKLQTFSNNKIYVKISFLKWWSFYPGINVLTHWGRVTHICVSKLTIIGWDNGLSPDRHQAIIWTNAGTLLMRTLGTNFSEILIESHSFSFKKMHKKMSSGKWRPSCLGLDVLKGLVPHTCMTTKCWPMQTLCVLNSTCDNTLRPIQNSRHFADGILKCNFLNENLCILKKICSLWSNRQYGSFGSDNGLALISHYLNQV